MRLSSPSALPTASNRRNADFLRVCLESASALLSCSVLLSRTRRSATLSSPPLHAATAHASSPRKRTRPPSPPQAHKPKQKRRARVTVDPDETTQVTGQDRYKLPLADADAYYFPDFVDPRTAQHWHDQLLNLEECEPCLRDCSRGAGLAAENTGVSSTRPLSLASLLAGLSRTLKQGTDRHSKSTANP